MRKLYLNAILLAILILAPLTYTATNAATSITKTHETPTTTKTTETTFTTQQYPYGPSNEPVYYMDWDWTYETQSEYGYINKAFPYKGHAYIETDYTMQQFGGWVIGLPGYDVYTFIPTQNEYYFYDGATLYVYDLETGSLLYEAPVPSAYTYAVGDFYAGDGLVDVAGYESWTNTLYVWTITGADVASINLTALTGADYVEPIYYFGGDFYSDYAGEEILLYTAFDIGGGRYNISLEVLSLENATQPAIVDKYWVAINVDDFGEGLLADVNGDGVNEVWTYYENNSMIWLDTYNVTEGAFDKISAFSAPTSYYTYEPSMVWVNDKIILSLLNGTHAYVANLTSGDYWEVAIPDNYTENTYYWYAVPGYVSNTLTVSVFADKMETATNDTGLLKLYVLNATNGEEIWNITLGEGKWFWSETWYMVSVGSTVYVFNYYGPYFTIDLSSGSNELDFISTASSLGSYSLYELDNGYYVGFSHHQIISFTKDGSKINFGFSKYELSYAGYYGRYPPPVDADGDGVPELLVVADAENGYTNDTYYWLDLDTLELEEMFGEPNLRNVLLVADILSVDSEGKLALIYAMNYTTSPSTKYFGWFNWSSSEWVVYYTNFYLGDFEPLTSDVAALIYYNKTSGKTYLAKIDVTSLEIIDEVELTGYPNTYSDEFDIVVTDMNGDGVDDLMIIPVNTADSMISVYSTDLTFMFSYTLGDTNIEYYGEGDFDNDGASELYFITTAMGYIWMFEKTGLELIDYEPIYLASGVPIYKIFTITYPGLGDVLLLSYDDGTLEVIYYDTIYEMIFSYTVSVGDTLETVWLSGDGSKLVGITSYWDAITFDASNIDYALTMIGTVDIFWPLYVDFYPYLLGMPVIYGAWFSDDVLYLTVGSSYYSSTGEYYETIVMNVYYYPDFNAPEIIAVQNTYVAGNVIQFDYGASDDLWLGYIYITATYTLMDGSVKVVDVAEQPAYRFGNSYYSTLILTLPPDIVDEIVSVSIQLEVTDLIWMYYDYYGYQPSGHSNVTFAYFTIDLVAPELHVTYPVNGSSFTLSKSDSVTFSVRVIENSEYPVNVLINVNNKYAFYVTTMGDFTVTIPANALVSGQNTIVIKATDMAGNEATLTIVINVQFTEPAEAAARAASTASTNSLASGIIAVFVALLALGIAVIRRS